MKKKVLVGLSSLALTAIVIVPSFTYAWFVNTKSYGLVLKSGESVATIDAYVFERQFAEDSTDYTYEIISTKVVSDNTSEDSGTIKLTVNDISFDYLNASVSDSVADVHRYPRVFIELDFIKEYFDAFITCELSTFNLKLGSDDFSTNLFEYKYGIYENGLPDDSGNMTILANATPTYGDDIDIRYVDEYSYVTDGDPLVNGSNFSVFNTENNEKAQLHVSGFAEKDATTDAIVFSKAFVMSMGINPKWFMSYIYSNPSFLHGNKTFSAEMEFSITISNNQLDGLEVIQK